jgi:hypothetical protein
MTKQQLLYSACIVAIVGIGILLGVRYITPHNPFTNPHNRTISIICDEQITHHLKKNLHDTAQELLQKNTSAQDLFEIIKKTAPTLSKITVDYRIPGHTKTRLTFDEPLCSIQQEHQQPLILSRHGAYAPYQHYKNDIVQNLPCVLVTESDFSSQSKKSLHQWICSLPLHFFERYAVRWNGPHDINILDQDNKNFEYKASHTTSFTPTVEQQLAQLRDMHMQQKNKLKIDIRFKDQFILVPLLQKKGVSHEKENVRAT